MIGTMSKISYVIYPDDPAANKMTSTHLTQPPAEVGANVITTYDTNKVT